MSALGNYPTPVERLPSGLWVKRDDLTHQVYGGNKVRKLERILDDARAHGARRLVTIGAVGSHHVLATTYFGTRAGFEVEAVLVPQRRTDHVAANVRAGLALGLRARPATTWAGAAVKAWWLSRARGAYRVALGGSSVAGAMAYVDAARELADQVRAGELPEPDVCVVALGSGGTAAGLAAGFAIERMKTRVVGAAVSRPVGWLGWAARRLARKCGGTLSRAEARERLECDASQLGAGYGEPTEAGARATEEAARAGLVLDATYTAKAFAAAMTRREKTVVYWHTLSSAPMGKLLEGAPDEAELPRGVRKLLLKSIA